MNESDVEMTVPAETGETRAIHGSEAAPQIDPITSKAQLQDVITAIPSPTKVLFLSSGINGSTSKNPKKGSEGKILPLEGWNVRVL